MGHRVIRAVVAAMLVVVTGCGSSGGQAGDPVSVGASSRGGSPIEATPSETADGASLSGAFDIGDRELYLECFGEGDPTVVLEPGQGVGRTTFLTLQDTLSADTRVCSYDRANVGASGNAPTPRTSGDVVDDLHRLLAAAGVRAPVVLVGHSAGAFVVLHYAREHPREVAGVLAMNPPPIAGQWLPRVLPLLDRTEAGEERAYYRGENDESFDWLASSRQMVATPTPRGVPLVLLQSTVAQCEGEVGPCSKTAEVYTRLGRRYAASWPGATFQAVDLGHDIYLDDQEMVVGLVRRLTRAG